MSCENVGDEQNQTTVEKLGITRKRARAIKNPIMVLKIESGAEVTARLQRLTTKHMAEMLWMKKR